MTSKFLSVLVVTKKLAFGGDTKRPTYGGDEHKHIENGGDKQPAPSFFAVLVVTAPTCSGDGGNSSEF